MPLRGQLCLQRRRTGELNTDGVGASTFWANGASSLLIRFLEPEARLAAARLPRFSIGQDSIIAANAVRLFNGRHLLVRTSSVGGLRERTSRRD